MMVEGMSGREPNDIPFKKWFVDVAEARNLHFQRSSRYLMYNGLSGYIRNPPDKISNASAISC